MNRLPDDAVPRRPEMTRWPHDEPCPDCGGARWTAQDYGNPAMIPDGVRELHDPPYCIRYLRMRLDDLCISLGRMEDL